VNKNKLLKLDPTVTGVKTGYTRPAGKCFVGSAHLGFKVITVVLCSDDWVKDTQTLLQYAKDNFQLQKKPTILEASIPIKSATLKELPVVSAASPPLLRKNEDLVWTAHFPKTLEAPIFKGDKLGYWESIDSDGFVRRVDGHAMLNIDREKNGGFAKVRNVVGVLAACVLFVAWFKRRPWA
jgi:D-alanyl-D-alanine carboxypeptidase